MGLFKKNPNENLYPTGEKTILTIIKNETAPGNLIWKVPYEDFNSGSKLIVGENEDALFVKNGEILDVFTGGEYTLNTNNYPVLSRIRNSLSGGISAYNCKIYYVMKSHALDNRWGTDSPIQVVDKEFGIATKLVSHGAYSIQIEDSKKFFLKFVQSNRESLNAADLSSVMRAPVNQKIKSSIGKVVSEMDGEIIGIISQVDDIANKMNADLNETFDEYGVRLVNFYIEALDIADDATRIKLEEARTRRITSVLEAQGEKAALDTLGITWAQKESAGIMHDAAKNEGNVTMSAGMGLGMGVGMGAGMGTAFGNVATNTMVSLTDNKQQPGEPQIAPQLPDRFSVKTDSGNALKCSCGAEIPEGHKFCSNCGKPAPVSSGPKFCPQCGCELQPNAKFCHGCGGKIA